jgi:hypothetical protein
VLDGGAVGPYPVCGSDLLVACAAWATFVRAGSWRFGWSLTILFATNLACWFLASWIDEQFGFGLLKILKSEDRDMIRPSQVLLLFGPPITAQVFVAFRLRRRTRRTLPGRLYRP